MPPHKHFAQHRSLSAWPPFTSCLTFCATLCPSLLWLVAYILPHFRFTAWFHGRNVRTAYAARNALPLVCLHVTCWLPFSLVVACGCVLVWTFCAAERWRVPHFTARTSCLRTEGYLPTSWYAVLRYDVRNVRYTRMVAVPLPVRLYAARGIRAILTP